VKPGDFVYIHYSGHGSQTADLNGDERSGQDQTWVSYGARKGESEDKNNFDVLDDEINSWLAKLYTKTDQVVFVSDSCHSATVSRGEASVARALKIDDRSHPLGKQKYAQAAKHLGVRVGAARDHESAIEFRTEDDKFYGVFTWFWVQALQQVRAGETWNDVFKRASTQVTTWRGGVQYPQLEGERSRQVIGGGFIPMPPTIPIIKIDGDTVTIQAGILSGVTVDSVYRLYVPDRSDTHPSPLPGGDPQNLPTLTITEVKTFVSSGKTEGTFKKGDLVVEESHAYHFPPIKIYVDTDYPDGQDKPLLQAIRSAFQVRPDKTSPLPAYSLTDDPQQAEIHLYLLRPKLEGGQYVYEASDVLPKSFPEQSPEVWVLSPEHRLLYDNLRIPFDDAAPDRGLKVLRDNLNKLARIRELKALSSPRDSKLKVAVDVYQLSPVASCQEGPDCISVPGLGFHRKSGPYRFQELEGGIFPKGEIFTFTLLNESKDDYYCYLLNISPDGTVAAIFPDLEAGAEYAVVKAEEVRDLISEVGLLADLPGEETIKLIVSSQPIDISVLETAGFQQRGGEKGCFNPLERLLVNAVYGLRDSAQPRNDEWATEQVSFEVK
jgi:hypothetical protein